MEQGERFARTALLLGGAAMEKLRGSRVLLLGLGGVGGHCGEALARCGVGGFVLVDGDRVAETNLNRQLVALTSTLGQYKADVMARRILDINPRARVEAIPAYYRETADLGLWEKPVDLVVDAIDDVPAKAGVAARAQALGIKAVSCMGAANKLNPMGFEAADLYDTTVCPLCRAMRRAARERGVERLRVVYSKEQPRPCGREGERAVPGSAAFVTAAAGLMLAAEAVRLLTAENGGGLKR